MVGSNKNSAAQEAIFQINCLERSMAQFISVSGRAVKYARDLAPTHPKIAANAARYLVKTFEVGVMVIRLIVRDAKPR